MFTVIPVGFQQSKVQVYFPHHLRQTEKQGKGSTRASAITAAAARTYKIISPSNSLNPSNNFLFFLLFELSLPLAGFLAKLVDV